jgi:hypothetical protein
MTKQDTIDSFEMYWDEALPTIEVWNSYSAESAYVEGLRKVESWRTEVLPELAPVEVEEYFNLLFHEDDNRVVNFSGTIDLVEEDRLWDWKFPGRGLQQRQMAI